jgi:PST family polysaccharide transporter
MSSTRPIWPCYGADIKNLLKFAAGTTLINLMTALAALLRGKLAAVLLGTAGVGLYGQVDSFYRSLVQICILSTGAGVTRCVAELQGSGDSAGIRRAFWSITVFSVGLSGLVASLVPWWSGRLSGAMLGDPRYGIFLAVVAFGLPLQALSDIVLGVLIGLRDLRAQIWITAAYSAGGAAIYSLLIVRYGFAGAVYGCLGTAACSCAAALGFLSKNRGLRLRREGRERIFDPRLLRSILAIGLTGGIMAISDRVVVLGFRTLLIRKFGLEANGLYQVVYSLSQLTIAMAFGFVSTYLVPTLSGMQDPERSHVEFSSALRLTLLIATLGSAVTLLYGKFIILATYSSAFLGAMPLLRYQALGDFFRALTLLLSATIFSVHGWKPWFAIGMSFYAAYIFFFALLLPGFGMPAISIAYLLAHCATCSLAALLFVRYTRMHFLAGRGPLLVRCLALLAAGSLLAWMGPGFASYTLGAAGLLLWLRFALSSAEYRRLWSYVSGSSALLAAGGR